MGKNLEAASFLKTNMSVFKSKKAMVGFDAFVDKIVRVIKSKENKSQYEFFNDIGEFGEYIVTKKGKSCGIPLYERFTKLGGNAPILANALGELEINTDCVSSFGYPQVDSIFNGMSQHCSLFTIGNPGYTTALEFNDGKIMLSQRDALNALTYQTITDILGFDKFLDFFNNSNLIAMVNWSGIQNFNSIFEGIVENILPHHIPNKKQIMFFDLADVSDMPKEDICKCLKLIEEFNKHYKVVLGLNENEANFVFSALFPSKTESDLIKKGSSIYDNSNIDLLVVHTLTDSITWNGSGIYQSKSLFVRKPKLSTGGGDNFNAGLCAALMLELDPEAQMYIANAVSGYYVRNGHSPNINNLIETLEKWDMLIEIPE